MSFPLAPRSVKTLVLLLGLLLFIGTSAISFALDAANASAGIVINNRAEASYKDDLGIDYSAISQTVTIRVSAVSGVMVTPDEKTPSASVGPNDEFSRNFRICNAGNTRDSFLISQINVTSPAELAGLYFDIDSSGTRTGSDTAITLNQTLSPVIEPQQCIGVIAVVNSRDFAPNGNLLITLSARSTVSDAANGVGEDEGTIINTVGTGPRLTDPGNGSLPPLKLVNGAAQYTVSPGVPFTYDISFRNSGDIPARKVSLRDELPDGVSYIAGSLRLGTKPLSDNEDADEGSVQANLFKVELAEVEPGQVVSISFKAMLMGHAPSGTGFANTATISAENAAPAPTSTAVVVVDPFGTVYSGRAGAAAPIAGARVEITLDQDGTSLLQTTPGVGFNPNTGNENPYNTDGAGRYSFALTPGQLGVTPARYYVRVSAQGYLSRLLTVDVQAANAGLYSLEVEAADGQPLAVPGGFELVRQNIHVLDAAAVALNIPMFEPYGLQIAKTADKQSANIGDVVTYRIEINNPTAAVVSNVVVNDVLPASFEYAAGTARIANAASKESPIEPEVSGNRMTFRVGNIAPGSNARVTYRVRIGASAREGEQENIAVASGTFSSGERTDTAPARASVIVSSGTFSTRQLLLGRVFVDKNRNGSFDAGDEPVAGARIYLGSGQSVITDDKGLYSLPALNEGSQVISLDRVTVSSRLAIAETGGLGERGWSRLLRTPLGGGSLLKQNFSLVETADAFAHSSGEAKIDGIVKEPTDAAPVENRESPLLAGTYVEVATETIEPVPAGVVRLVSPAPKSVVMAPALQLDARVAINWKVKLEVNGREISKDNIGTTREDQKNQVTTYTFVGIGLKPGPNKIRLTPIGPDGNFGTPLETELMGRGPAKRLQIVPEKYEIQAGGQDFTVVRIRAFDQWGNPAADDQIAVETDSGELTNLLKGRDGSIADSGHSAHGSSQASDEEPKPAGSGHLMAQLNGGEVTLRLVGSGAPGEAMLKATNATLEAESRVRIIPEERPAILVGMTELSYGQSVPELSLHNDTGNLRKRLSLFYNGRFPGGNTLTLAYDSNRPINRTAGRDRMFQMDPLDRAYPVFGDSSTRFEAAPSNSKLYARLDHRLSYGMFGDFEADMDDLALTGYSRKLTGVKMHVENSDGDFVTVTGARPDTSYARDVFPAGGLNLFALTHGEILPGSETIAIEVRDRRNPEVILSRETLTRSIDYNLDTTTGELFLLRYISAFDYAFNLVQLVATYEHRAASMSSAVYTARALKNFGARGLKLGFSGLLQRQEDVGSFVLSGMDIEKRLPRNGKLKLAFAHSQGRMSGGGNYFEGEDLDHTGNAYFVEIEQPLPQYEATVRARYAASTAGFFNPFGTTVTPGSRKGEVFVEVKPWANSAFKLGLIDERNKTANVDNSRLTLSALWEHTVNERLRFRLGFDHRHLNDEVADRTTDSNMVSAAAEIKVTEKLHLSAKREQNLGEADPTYPDQTTLAATYQVNNWAKIFLTQRLASAAVTPIGDFTQAGFSSTNARRETAFGVETRFGKYTSLVSRYQLENGASGADSFAVIGLQNRLPLNKELSLEFGGEHSFHLAGAGKSYKSARVGLGWQPTKDFRAAARYELRDRQGFGQLISAGAAGRIGDNITALSRVQWTRSNFEGRSASSMDSMAAVAVRPLSSDKVGLLFSYNQRSMSQYGNKATSRERIDSLSTDGYFQATDKLELYGRFALRFTGDGQADLPFVSTLTYLSQGRAQYRISKNFDWAAEMRRIVQPASGTSRTIYGAELGVWITNDMRLGGGYNFSSSGQPPVSGITSNKGGFYFTISSKLSNLFDLFAKGNASLTGAKEEDGADGGARK